MKTRCKFNITLLLVLTVMCVMPIFQTVNAQSYLNINLSDGGNFYSLLSEMKDIIFDGAGNATFTKTDDSFVTTALSDITNLTMDASPGDGSPLPVELVSFMANIADTAVVLNWATATEVNNYGFEVERSSLTQNVNSEWLKVGFVLGSGTSNSQKEYEFFDTEPKSGFFTGADTLEYRLKQIDLDGSFEYFNSVAKVILSNITGVGDEDLPAKYELFQNFPNPFNPSTTINFQLPVKSFTTLKVYDILGKEVAVLFNEEKAAGKYSISFNGSQLASGIYISRITAGNYTSLIKMILIK